MELVFDSMMPAYKIAAVTMQPLSRPHSFEGVPAYALRLASNYSVTLAPEVDFGYGDLIFVSGIASRDFVTDQVPGLTLDSTGKKTGYDIRKETRATLENIKKI